MKTHDLIEIVISEIDFYLNEKLREIRINKNPKIAQVTLSQMIGVADGFVSKVENMKLSSKYNLWHINKIIKIFNLKYSDLFPVLGVKNDIVRIRLQFKQTASKDDKSYDVISIVPLSENEMELFKVKKLPYSIKIK